MTIRTRMLPLALGLLTSLGAIADEETISVNNSFAGTIITPITAGMTKTGTPWGPEPMIVSDARMFGKGRSDEGLMKVVSRFDLFAPFTVTDCPATIGEHAYRMNLVYAFSVTTYKDFSQLYVNFDVPEPGESTHGYICVPVNETASGKVYYIGRVKGQVVGGTGRYTGATGEIISDFYGHDLAGPFVDGEDLHASFGSFFGTLEGEITIPSVD